MTWVSSVDRESVERIKQKIRSGANGGYVWENRGSGKTQAILELIKEDHDGCAFYLCPTVDMADCAKVRWFKLYGEDCMYPNFITSIEKTRGYSWPVYIDEWPMFSEQEQDDIYHWPLDIKCRIG